MIEGRNGVILRGILIVLAMSTVAMVVHPEQFTGKIYASTDARAVEAHKIVGQQILAAGEYPLWNPFVFTGMPSFSSLAYTPNIYPLDAPIVWLTRVLGLPPMTWLMSHVILLGVFTAIYVRWRGHSMVASLMAGALMLVVPQYVSWSAYGHGTKVMSLAWMPLILLCVEGVLRKGKLIYAFGLAAALGIVLRRAHPQIPYYMAMAGFFWLCFYAAPALKQAAERREMLRRGGLLVVAAMLALGVALILYLPILSYQGHSIRGAAGTGGGVDFDYATGWSLAFSEIPTFWWPTVVGFGKASYVGQMPFTDYPNYIGAPILLFALVALLLRRDRWSIMLATLALFATAVAMGKHSFVYKLLYEFLPGFSKFRVPVMILIIQEFALILLAVVGVESLLARLKDKKTPRPKWMGMPALFALGLVGFVLLILGTAGGGFLRENSIQSWQGMRPGVPMAALEAAARLARGDALRLGLVFLTIGATLVAFARGRIPAMAAMAVLGFLVFIDLHAVTRPLVHPEDHLKGLARDNRGYVAVEAAPVVRDHDVVREYAATDDAIEWLKRQEARPRIWPLDSLAGENLYAVHGIVSLGGYHAAKLKLYEDLRKRLYGDRGEWHLANLLAAGWVVSPRAFTDELLEALRSRGVDLEKAHEGSGGVVYRNLTAQPRAWLVGEYELEQPGGDTASEAPAPRVLDRVASPDFDFASKAILSRVPEPEPASAAGTVEVLEELTHEMSFRVDTPAPAVLVTADIWYPGWSVEIDDEPAELLRADYALRGVAIPAGSHTVRYRFVDSAYRSGKWISRVCALMIVLGLAISMWFEWRPRRAVATA